MCGEAVAYGYPFRWAGCIYRYIGFPRIGLINGHQLVDLLAVEACVHGQSQPGGAV